MSIFDRPIAAQVRDPYTGGSQNVTVTIREMLAAPAHFSPPLVLNTLCQALLELEGELERVRVPNPEPSHVLHGPPSQL